MIVTWMHGVTALPGLKKSDKEDELIWVWLFHLFPVYLTGEELQTGSAAGAMDLCFSQHSLVSCSSLLPSNTVMSFPSLLCSHVFALTLTQSCLSIHFRTVMSSPSL